MKHEWKSVCSDVFFDTAPSTQHILHNIIKTASSIGSFRILSSAKTLVSEWQLKQYDRWDLCFGLRSWKRHTRNVIISLSIAVSRHVHIFMSQIASCPMRWRMQPCDGDPRDASDSANDAPCWLPLPVRGTGSILSECVNPPFDAPYWFLTPTLTHTPFLNTPRNAPCWLQSRPAANGWSYSTPKICGDELHCCIFLFTFFRFQLRKQWRLKHSSQDFLLHEILQGSSEFSQIESSFIVISRWI